MTTNKRYHTGGIVSGTRAPVVLGACESRVPRSMYDRMKAALNEVNRGDGRVTVVHVKVNRDE